MKIPIHTSDAPVIEKVDLVVRAKETPEKPSKFVSYREHKYAPMSLGDHETEAGSWVRGSSILAQINSETDIFFLYLPGKT